LKGAWDSDRDPLSALREGDPEPFEAFVAERAGTFLGFFRRLGAGPAEAEDLVQELFLKLFRHAETYQPSGRFGAFAFRVARNAWIDRQRRRAASPTAPASGEEDLPGAPGPTEQAVDPADGPGERLAQLEEAARVRRALARLSERHRLVFELGVLQELSYAEISELLEIPEGTVKSRMFYAVRKLREALGAAGAGGHGGADTARRSAS
jgi:RNA polymerase sigma-70 factor (ECF subfamily)